MVTTKTRTIIHNRKILGGEPIIIGTRIPVRSVVMMMRAYQGDVQAVQRALPSLSAEDIALSLQYERDHPDEVAFWIQYDDSDDDDPL